MSTETRPISIFVLAGEPSGDRIGSDLVAGLRRRAEIRLSGVGGEALAGQGLSSLFPMSDLSVMGFSDVIRRLPKLFWRLDQAARAILRAAPDVVVLIDSQVFSATLAKRLRKKGFAGPIVLYVAPAVWAWKPERAPGLKPLFEEVLAVLPFEPAVMARLGGPTTSYVGHPAVAAMPFRRQLPTSGPLLLLPGSRDGEIARTLPMFRVVAERFASNPRVTGLVLPTPARLRDRMVAATRDWAVPVRVVADEEAKHLAFASAVAAVAVTGTVTLELALAGVPMVTTYVADAGQAKRFAKYAVRFVTLPNIIMDRPVVPELLFTTPDAVALGQAVDFLLTDPQSAEQQLRAFAEMRALMETGTADAPITDPVTRILAHLPGQQVDAG